MELIKDDAFQVLQSHTTSGQQQSAIHAPISANWRDAIFATEGSGGYLVPDIIVASTGSRITLEWHAADPLESLLERIQSAFGLNKDELAKVCNTTRKTIYNWLGGTTEPQERNRERLFTLDVLADDWAGAGYSTDRVTLKQSVVDGQSVFQMLCEEPIDSDLVLFAGSRIALQDRRSPLADPFST